MLVNKKESYQYKYAGSRPMCELVNGFIQLQAQESEYNANEHGAYGM